MIIDQVNVEVWDFGDLLALPILRVRFARALAARWYRTAVGRWRDTALATEAELSSLADAIDAAALCAARKGCR